MRLSFLEWSGIGLFLFWGVVNLYFYFEYPETYQINGDIIAILGLVFFGVGYRKRVDKKIDKG